MKTAQHGETDGKWASGVIEAGTEDVARRLRKLAAGGALEIPLPGGGRTWARWSALCGQSALLSGDTSLLQGHSPARSAVAAGLAGLKEKVKGLFGGRGGSGKKLKVTNIVEQIDIGPLRPPMTCGHSSKTFQGL